jgi:hypothetical protein
MLRLRMELMPFGSLVQVSPHSKVEFSCTGCCTVVRWHRRLSVDYNQDARVRIRLTANSMLQTQKDNCSKDRIRWTWECHLATESSQPSAGSAVVGDRNVDKWHVDANKNVKFIFTVGLYQKRVIKQNTTLWLKMGPLYFRPYLK